MPCKYPNLPIFINVVFGNNTAERSVGVGARLLAVAPGAMPRLLAGVPKRPADQSLRWGMKRLSCSSELVPKSGRAPRGHNSLLNIVLQD
jgi:hypothetical protein